MGVDVNILLEEYGFKKTSGFNEFKKYNYTVVLTKVGLIITKYTPNVGRFMWSETYFNLSYFEKYLRKNHK